MRGRHGDYEAWRGMWKFINPSGRPTIPGGSSSSPLPGPFTMNLPVAIDSDSSYSISSTISENATTYLLTNGAVVIAGPSLSNVFSPIILTAGAPFVLQIIANNSTGSTFSDILSSSTIPLPGTPVIAGSPAPTGTNAGIFSFTVPAVTNAATYTLMNGANVIAGPQASNIFEFVLQPNTIYAAFHAVVKNASGVSTSNNLNSFVTQVAPVSPTITLTKVDSDITVTVSNYNQTYFNYQFLWDTTTPPTTTRHTGNANIRTFLAFAPNTYYFRVWVVGDFGAQFSNIASSVVGFGFTNNSFTFTNLSLDIVANKTPTVLNVNFDNFIGPRMTTFAASTAMPVGQIYALQYTNTGVNKGATGFIFWNNPDAIQSSSFSTLTYLTYFFTGGTGGTLTGGLSNALPAISLNDTVKFVRDTVATVVILINDVVVCTWSNGNPSPLYFGIYTGSNLYGGDPEEITII